MTNVAAAARWRRSGGVHRGSRSESSNRGCIGQLIPQVRARALGSLTRLRGGSSGGRGHGERVVGRSCILRLRRCVDAGLRSVGSPVCGSSSRPLMRARLARAAVGRSSARDSRSRSRSRAVCLSRRCCRVGLALGLALRLALRLGRPRLLGRRSWRRPRGSSFLIGLLRRVRQPRATGRSSLGSLSILAKQQLVLPVCALTRIVVRRQRAQVAGHGDRPDGARRAAGQRRRDGRRSGDERPSGGGGHGRRGGGGRRNRRRRRRGLYLGSNGGSRSE